MNIFHQENALIYCFEKKIILIVKTFFIDGNGKKTAMMKTLNGFIKIIK